MKSRPDVVRFLIQALIVWGLGLAGYRLAHGGESLFDGSHSLVVLNTTDYEKTLKVRDSIEFNGGHVTHVFPPNILHAYLTVDAEKSARRSNLVKLISDQPVDIPAGLKPVQQFGFQTWNFNFVKLLATRGDEPTGDQDFNSHKAPDLENTNNLFTLRGQKNFFLTSEYMIGSVSVGVVFVESNGQLDKKTESWNQEDKEEVMNQIYKGLDWWAEKGGYKANLSWTYEFMDGQTRYEPISRTKDESVLWVKECMDHLGYRDAEDYTLNREMANDLRDKWKTDWAFVIYVVPSTNDLDGYFAKQTGIAWGYLGGPYMIVTNKCNGWGYTGVWKVVAHETGHIFNALDEYKGSSGPTDKSGRLNVINGNHETSSTGTLACIMKSNDLKICDFTLGQIGWVDDDSNGVYDSDYLLLSTRYHAAKVKQEAAARIALNTGDGGSSGLSKYAVEENLLYYDDFSVNTGWYEDQNNFVRDSVYHMFDPQFGNASWLETPYSDFVASVKTRWMDGSSVSGYGLMFRIFGPNDSYLFYINGDGQYCIGKYELGNWNYLADWDRSAAIHLNGTNTLTVKAVANRFTFMINGQPVKELTDASFRRGNIGFAILPEVQVSFDDLLITSP